MSDELKICATRRMSMSVLGSNNVGLLMRQIMRYTLLLCLMFNSGCVSTIVGAAADVAIEAVKIPFKVGAAVVDVVSGDDEEGDTDKKKNDEKE